MLANILIAVAMLCMFCAGFAGGRGWRLWGEDLELDPGTLTAAGLFLLLALGFVIAGATA